MQDWITSIFGLIGVIIGGIFTIFVSWLSERKKEKKEFLEKEEQLYSEFSEPLKESLDKLNREEGQCIKLQSTLSRIELLTNSENIKLYEKNRLYPMIQFNFLNEYDPTIIWGSLDAVINKLYVCLNIYHELKDSTIADEEKIILLNQIHKYAINAMKECTEEQLSLPQKIFKMKDKVLQSEVDTLNRYIKKSKKKEKPDVDK